MSNMQLWPRAILKTLIVLALLTAVRVEKVWSAEEAKKAPQSQDKTKPDDIWADEQHKGQPGPPPFERGREGAMDRPQEPRGEGRPPWLEMDPNLIERVMQEIKKSDPGKAKELESLREKDPDRFRDELREHGREAFAKIGREYWDSMRRRWHNEFVEWLQEHYSREAEELTKSRERDPELYAKKFEIVSRKYRPLYDAWRRNPELGKVMMEDFELRERHDELLRKVKGEKNDAKRRELVEVLRQVVDRRFELIVKRKEIAYEDLLKKLEELQKDVKKSREDLTKAKDQKYKQENVEKHLKELLEENMPGFNWD
jgi:hypothetical protein